MGKRAVGEKDGIDGFFDAEPMAVPSPAAISPLMVLTAESDVIDASVTGVKLGW